MFASRMARVERALMRRIGFRLVHRPQSGRSTWQSNRFALDGGRFGSATGDSATLQPGRQTADPMS